MVILPPLERGAFGRVKTRLAPSNTSRPTRTLQFLSRRRQGLDDFAGRLSCPMTDLDRAARSKDVAIGLADLGWGSTPLFASCPLAAPSRMPVRPPLRL